MADATSPPTTEVRQRALQQELRELRPRPIGKPGQPGGEGGEGQLLPARQARRPGQAPLQEAHLVP